MLTTSWAWDPDRKSWRVRTELTFPQKLLAEENQASYHALIDELVEQLKAKLKAVGVHATP